MEKNGEEKRSYYVNLLIMLLMRFPEVFSINYSIIKDNCRVSFMIAGELQGKDYNMFKEGLKEAVDAYRELQEEDTVLMKIRKNNYSRVSMLQIELKVDALLPEEIGVVAAYIKDHLEERLLVETDDHFNDDDFINPEDYIDFFFNRRQDTEQENLFAFREAGKVYIYDR